MTPKQEATVKFYTAWMREINTLDHGLRPPNLLCLRPLSLIHAFLLHLSLKKKKKKVLTVQICVKCIDTIQSIISKWDVFISCIPDYMTSR